MLLLYALMKEMVASNMILFATVPKFRSPNKGKRQGVFGCTVRPTTKLKLNATIFSNQITPALSVKRSSEKFGPVHNATFLYKNGDENLPFCDRFTLIRTKMPQTRKFSKTLSKMDVHKNGDCLKRI